MENPIILSILICTINGREACLERLLNQLNKQQTDCVEILIEKDNRKLTIGQKRNILLDRASGEYCCFIDDDDYVCDNYIAHILEALKSKPDVVGLDGVYIQQAKNIKKTFAHSKIYKTWEMKNGIYVRCPNHLNPVKTEIARQVRFKEINRGEDKDYSDRLLPLLSTEVYITKEPIYFYLK